MDFKIITDSASDIPKYIIDEYNLHVIPTPVVVDGKDYFDGETIFPADFYKTLVDPTKEISTYHISELMFYNAFKPYAENGDSLLYMCFSTGVAGTFNAARLAKEELLEEFPDFDITIIDTKCASMGYGLTVYKLLKMQKAGADKDTIIEAANFLTSHVEHVVTVETLKYLYKGGRLSPLSYAVGSGISIKPLIDVDENGSLRAYSKVRGRKKALKAVVKDAAKRCNNFENQIIGIVHGDCEDVANDIANEIKENYNVKEIVISYIGCAIGAHIGPGTIGIVAANETNDKYEVYF